MFAQYTENDDDDEIDKRTVFSSLLNFISYVSNRMNIEWEDRQTRFFFLLFLAKTYSNDLMQKKPIEFKVFLFSSP